MWQPIETAPKGKRVLICYWLEGVRMLCRGGGNGCQTEKFTEQRVNIGSPRYTNPKIYRIDAVDKEGKRIEVKPTHWQPLPDLPEV